MIWFSSWDSIFRIVITCIAAYVGLVLILRVSGKRTLSKMNAFDFVVTIALGSVLSSVIVLKDVTVADGLVAIATLVALQFVISALSVRVRAVRHAVKSEPTLLCFHGKLLTHALRDSRITPDEVRTAIRQKNGNSIDDVEAVILEADGTFSVISKGEPAVDLVDPDVKPDYPLAPEDLANLPDVSIDGQSTGVKADSASKGRS